MISHPNFKPPNLSDVHTAAHNGRTGTLEVAQAFHLVGDELILRWTLQGQESCEESDDLGRPCLTPVATAGRGLVA